MAFLCPSRLGRTKQKHEVHSSILERISGEVGFDPLVKFELARYNANNPEAVRIILHDFSTCSPDELTVRQGQKVHILFREGDWAYVLTADKKEGFIPYTTCAKLVTASSKRPTKTYAPTGSDRNEPKQTDRINNNTYNVRNNKSVVIHHVHNERLHVPDNFLSTDWSNKSHKHDAVVNGLKTKCASQPREQYDDNRNLINSYLSSSTYRKLPTFIEVFSALQAEDVLVKPDVDVSDVSPRGRNDSEISMCPSQTFDDEISPRTVCSINTNESSFISETSTEFNSDDTYVVLYDFRGRHREDVDVDRDENVVVLEKSDPFWYWIRKRDGSEGYVPSNYIGHIKDPKVLAILEERYKRDAVRPGHTTHHTGCRCEECARMSPATDLCSLASSTLNSETKTRPPKPPRTRIKVPTDSTQTPKNKTKSSSRKQNSGHQLDQKQQPSNSSKFSSHHLSLENVSVCNDKNDGPSTKLKPSGSTTDLHQSRKKSGRHRRPNYREYRSQSTRSYTFEESSDYFDAYFCDEPDPDFKLKPDNKADVVNVTEILKQRNAGGSAKTRSHSHGKTTHGNMWMKNGSKDNGHNVLNLRQYMQTLPSTAIVTEQEKHDDKPKAMSASEVPKHQETRRDKRERRSADHPQRMDWSFGYPRKQRSNHNSRCSSTPDPNTLDIALPKGKKPIGDTTKSNVKTVGSQTDLEDVVVIPKTLEDPSDQMFLELLNATDSLLDVSEKILSSSKANAKKVNTDDTDKGGDRRSSSSETDDDVNDKCNNFIMNQVIDTNSGLLTNRSETSCTVKSDVSDKSRNEVHESSDENSDEVFREVKMTEDKPRKEIDTSTLAAGFEKGTDSIDVRNNNNNSRNKHQDVETSYTSKPTEHNNTENARTNKKSRSSDSASKKMSERNDKDNPSSSGTIDTNELFDETVNYTDVRGVTEFVVQYDYDPEPDSGLAISICRNEILHISLDMQEDESWYWAFSPRLHTYGYVPRDYVKIPLVTII